MRLEADTWSLAEAINAGVAAARNALIAKTDADILISRNSRAEFDAVARALARGKVGIALAQATDLPPSLSPAQAYALAGRARITRRPADCGPNGAKVDWSSSPVPPGMTSAASSRVYRLGQ